MTAEQKAQMQVKKEQTRFHNNAHDIFLKSGFRSIKCENIHFTLSTGSGDRTTELDGLYLHENIIIITEQTHKKEVNEHLSKKRIIAELIRDHPKPFIEEIKEKLPEFKDYFHANRYMPDDYIVKYLYFSMHPVGTEHVDAAARAGIITIGRPLANYFHALAKTIAASAKYELIKFLRIEYSEIGDAKLSGGTASNDARYKGFLLPDKNSTYPEGYRIVSFYADPKSLLKKCYVVRKNSWTDPDKSYQRVIDISKIREMRKYLSEEKRVYVNNIIATLPGNTDVQNIDTRKQLTLEEQKQVRPVTIVIPDEFNVIGLIDGQHRVFSYHEGTDEADKEISNLRDRQNLLITGIIYPDNITEDERVQFEAKLFIEINEKQKKVQSTLTQEIQLIVNPYSTTAIARAIISKLSKSGPLKDKLEEHAFDDSERKLKVASIVSYGLKPLIKLEGDDCLFSVWDEPELKKQILEKKKDQVALGQYIDFCHKEIGRILLAAKLSRPESWEVGDDSVKMLTTTSVNGLIRCLRRLIKEGKQLSEIDYQARLKNFGTFKFSVYKSSHWNQMGNDIYDDYFSEEGAD